MVAAVAVQNINGVNGVELVLFGVGAVSLGHARVEAAAQQGGQAGFLKLLCVGPLPAVIKVGGEACFLAALLVDGTPLRVVGVLRLVVGGVHIVYAAGKAGIHDGQVLIGQGNVHHEVGLISLDEGDHFIHLVGIHLCPGLIEGASQGVGLGTQFLRHIERTRVILHVIDMSASEGRDPYEDYLQINKELETYNLRLMERPQIIVANKMDMPEAEENLKEFKEKLAANYDEFDELPQIFPISSLAHQGLENLLEATAELLDQTDEFLLYNEDDMEQEEVYYGFNEEERPFEISRDDDASWVLSGEKLEKLFVMTNMERDESIMKFARQLRGMGVDEALRERGAKDGDIVRIGNFEFEFVD